MSVHNQRNPNLRKEKTSDIKLLYANVRGLRSKLTSIKNVLSEVKPAIAVITETHLSENQGVKIDGYVFFGRAREGKIGGGVGIFVKEEMKMVVAPHLSHRRIEIIWISMKMANEPPILVGVYYGKQESVCLEEIQEEMDLLTEEILEMKTIGEVILCMDANAKIGLMGEPISRNGNLLKETIEECELEIMNGKSMCKGTITRQNRRKEDEKSAIDFVLTTQAAEKWVKKMLIDEDGVHRITNKNDSDHNTIIIDLRVNKPIKQTEVKSDWNYKASEEKWESFRSELRKSIPVAEDIMANTNTSISDRYEKWEKIIYKAAIKSIGRTTYKNKTGIQSSEQVKKLRKEKTELKKQFEEEQEHALKGEKLDQYMSKQKEIKDTLEKEEEESTRIRFEKMISEANNGGFWRERRSLKRDETTLWMTTKDQNGKRIFDPEQNKENVAAYFENLYRDTPTQHHPYHSLVENTVDHLSTITENHNSEENENDMMPTRQEVKEIIQSKKDKKATTDWKNTLLKRGGEPMVDLIMCVIEAFWREEETPKKWNQGIITCIWKGKGDIEMMENQRGITVSSSIGTIPEEVLNRRIIKTIGVTQAQAGGQKGASTTDQVFILRNIIEISKKEGRHLLISFFDVQKAYDRASMPDMLYILHKNGLQGKNWRLTKALNVDLTARVKTKAGLTREIKREKGGKQGGKLMVPMFAKTMDTLAEDMAENPNLGIQILSERIPALLFMDDVLSFSEGYDQQMDTLEAINDFGKKHQMGCCKM